MMLGVLCFAPTGVLVLDDTTVVGIFNNPVIPVLWTVGSGLWLHGYHRLGKAISGCGY